MMTIIMSKADNNFASFTCTSNDFHSFCRKPSASAAERMEMMTKVAKIMESRAETGKSLGNAAAKQDDTVQMERKVATAKENQNDDIECGMIYANLEPDAEVNFDEEVIYDDLDQAVLKSEIAKQKGAATEAEASSCEELYDVPSY